MAKVRAIIVAAAVSAGMTCAMPLALSLEKERSAKVRPGERVQIWLGANYGQRCRSAGPPIFKLVGAPTLGEVGTELVPYVVPNGEHCAGNSYTGLRVWYQAGPGTGTDTFTYTIEFPHESSNPRPSKGPQPATATVTIE